MEEGGRSDAVPLQGSVGVGTCLSEEGIFVDASFEALRTDPTPLVRALLPWFETRRWSGLRGEDARQIEVLDQIRMSSSPGSLLFAALVKVLPPKTLADGLRTFYLPLCLDIQKEEAQTTTVKCRDVVLEMREGEYSRDYCLWVLRGLVAAASMRGEQGFFVFKPLDGLPEASGVDQVSALGKGDTTNIVTKLDTDSGPFTLKTYKNVTESNPEPEMLSALTLGGFANCPRMLGEVAYSGSGQELVLTLLQRFEDNVGDGRQPFSESLQHELTSFDKFKQAPDSLLLAWKVGGIIASMHLILGECRKQAFGSTEITEVDVEEWKARAIGLLRRAMAEARRKQKYLGSLVSDLLPELASREGRVIERFKSIRSIVGMPKIRTHQDLHLAQLLTVRRSAKNLDFLVIDFEGDPQRKGAARRERDCPLRDLGTMARSFSYLRYYVLKKLLQEAGHTCPLESLAFYDLKGQCVSLETLGTGLLDRLFSVSKNWETRVCKKMLQGYLDAIRMSSSRLLSCYEKVGFEAVDSIVKIWELEKAILELNYELSHRPENVLIPLVGVLGLT